MSRRNVHQSSIFIDGTKTRENWITKTAETKTTVTKMAEAVQRHPAAIPPQAQLIFQVRQLDYHYHVRALVGVAIIAL
jgi:hypothetical protein